MQFIENLRREGAVKAVRHLISAPFIYAIFPAFVLVHAFFELYHFVCFPLYGIPYVQRSRYLRVDRQKLSYLNWVEKLNCVYCGYVNGILNYMVEIAARTETYWCAIKHQKYPGMIEPAHHADFAEYGDEDGYVKTLNDRPE